jgi:hypothetical protein
MENAMGIGDGERGVFRNGLGLEALLDNDKHDTHIFFFCALVSAFSSFLFRVCDSNAVISSGHSVLKLLRDGFA